MSQNGRETNARFNRTREEEAVLHEDLFGHFLRLLGSLSAAVDHLVIFGLCCGLAFLASAGSYYVGEPVIMGDYGWLGTLLGSVVTLVFAGFVVVGIAGAIIIPVKWLNGAKRQLTEQEERGDRGS